MISEQLYRADLPPIPGRMRGLPVRRGYPVPWFVALVNGDYDFRIQDAPKRGRALKENRCWSCGDQLGRFYAFVIGPMCAINRTSSEPPSHRECAEFSVVACPFLNLQEAERRAARLPDNASTATDFGLARNPGVALVWITKLFRPYAVQRDYLIEVGDPTELSWWCQGRTATRAEILASIDSGYPVLQNAAAMGGPGALAELERSRNAALDLLPAA